jgi:hypothetical protein
MPFYVADNHEYNWSGKILIQLTLQRHTMVLHIEK